MTEKEVQKQVKKYLKSLLYCWFYHPSDRFMVGLPDFIICYKGRFIAIELKREGKYLRNIQEYALKKIKEAQGMAELAYSLEDVKRLLNQRENGSLGGDVY